MGIRHNISNIPSHIRDLDIILWTFVVSANTSNIMHVFHCVTIGGNKCYITMMS